MRENYCEWLNLSLEIRLRELINENRPEHYHPGVARAYQNICVMMDRIGDSVEWLNTHSAAPADVNEFYLFLLHSDIVIKNIATVCGKLSIDKLYNDKNPASRQYLVPLFSDAPHYFSADKSPTDDIIWSYIRALSFAHTDEVGDKRYEGTFLNPKEVHTSPFVNVERYPGKIWIVVYSNKRKDENLNILLPFDLLKCYVASRYSLLERIYGHIEKVIKEHNGELAKERIDEDRGPIDALKEMRDKYAARFGEFCTYVFDFPLMCLQCQSTDPANDAAVEQFKHGIMSVVHSAALEFWNLDYDACIKTLESSCPRTFDTCTHQQSYDLQNVFAYLEDYPSNWRYTIARQIHAKNIASGFASKHVYINVDAMQDDEIKMLTSLACKMEGAQHE